MTNLEHGDAYFSPDRRYRYALSRVWDATLPMLGFIGLNPSTADEKRLDPTLRRVVSFAMREDCGGFWMGNLFAFRATDPSAMKAQDEPVGPENDRWLKLIAHWCPKVVAGWGVHGVYRDREREVRRLLQGHEILCLGTTASGHPRHPLYIRRDTPLVTYQDILWRPRP